ncbi:aldo/keto reductase [Streptomyces roseoverticillatus]|uniref:Aldo/keto reductase n=1 Tax=Streptomyces roseoverticillatus TaxID=66429 RepID=A0ABV3INB0_9ACTN
MRYRTLGTGGPLVSAVGLGCLGMSGGYGPADPAECEATIRHGLDLGITLLDTADFYGAGANEELVGRAISGRREEVVLATRGGLRAAVPGGPPTIADGSPGHLRQACEASLRRLGTGHVDIYYLGRVDPAVPVEESVGALAELVAEGKIRHVGLSEATAEQLRRAHAVHPLTAVESEYSLWERHVEDDILPTVRELGIGFTAHTPLGKGFLAGALVTTDQLGPGDHRRNHPRFQGENFRRNRRLIAEAEEASAETGLPLATLALAWLLSRGPEIVPIPGTRRRTHLEANAAAADHLITPEQADRLAALVPPALVSGSRQPVRR